MLLLTLWKAPKWFSTGSEVGFRNFIVCKGSFERHLYSHSYDIKFSISVIYMSRLLPNIKYWNFKGYCIASNKYGLSTRFSPFFSILKLIKIWTTAKILLISLSEIQAYTTKKGKHTLSVIFIVWYISTYIHGGLLV